MLKFEIEKALEVSKNLIILGDMNEDLLNPNFHNLKDVLLINFLQNVVLESTRLGAILDPILISEDIDYVKSGVISMPPPISDHRATIINLPFSYLYQSSYERLVWMYKRANLNFLNKKFKIMIGLPYLMVHWTKLVTFLQILF